MRLRPYQQDCLDACKEQTGLCVLPTGSGKSHIIGALSLTLDDVLIICPRRELVAQNKLKTDRLVCTVNLAYKRKLTAKHIIVDEAHLISDNSQGMYQQVLKGAIKVWGFSASPYRLDIGHLVPTIFDKIIYEIEADKLVSENYLVPTEYVTIPPELLLNVTNLNSMAKVSEEVRPGTQAAIEHFLINKMPGSSSLIFCCDLKHCEIVQKYVDYPIVSGKTPKKERDYLIDLLRSGKIEGIINCELLHTGFDYPALNNVVILRPTESYTLYTQMCGRVTRLQEDKSHGHVFDYTFSYFNFKPNKTDHIVICLNCGQDTDNRLNRCHECDANIIRTERPTKPKICINCKSENSLRAKFCNDCGTYLVAPDIHFQTRTKFTLHMLNGAGVINLLPTETSYRGIRLEAEPLYKLLGWLGVSTTNANMAITQKSTIILGCTKINVFYKYDYRAQAHLVRVTNASNKVLNLEGVK